MSQKIDLRNGSATNPYRLAFSLGRAAFHPDAPQTLDELLSAADAAMYAEKTRKRASR